MPCGIIVLLCRVPSEPSTRVATSEDVRYAGVWPLGQAPFSIWGVSIMNKTGKAYFVPDPSRLEDLTVPHLVSDERPYEIVKTITLGSIDYGNFITDMLTDRSFIEEHHELCEKGEVWRCLFIHKRGQTAGVLVMPEDDCYVGWAAYITE